MARATADRAAFGAAVPGWPTSMCMTLRPADSRAIAARITSITIKLGTWLRAEPSANKDAAAAGRSIVERSAMLLPANLLNQPLNWGVPSRAPFSPACSALLVVHIIGTRTVRYGKNGCLFNGGTLADSLEIRGPVFLTSGACLASQPVS